MYTPKESVSAILDQFRTKKILIVGDSMLDAYWYGSVSRISPEAPVPVVLINNREYRLGGAANVALNIRKIGGRSQVDLYNWQRPGRGALSRIIEKSSYFNGIYPDIRQQANNCKNPGYCQ